MRIDEEQTQLLLTMPHNEDLPDIPKDFGAAVNAAKPTEELLLDESADAQQMYLGFLKEALNEQPGRFSLEHKKDLYLLDAMAIQHMQKERIPYDFIIEAATNSPLTKDEENSADVRWGAAITKVTAAVNPVLMLPELVHAQSLQQCIRRPDVNDEEIYHAYLKSVFDRDPSLRIEQADAIVAKLLKKNGRSDDAVRAVLEFSPEIKRQRTSSQKMEEMQDKVKAYEAVTEYKDQLLKDAAKARIPEKQAEESRSAAAAAPDDVQIYHAMRDKLLDLRDSEKMQDVLTYWKDVMKVIEDAMLQVQKAKIACKIICTWAAGIEKASQDFGLENSPDLKEIHKTAKDLLHKVEEKAVADLEEWDKIYSMVTQMETLSSATLHRTLELIERNPILKDPLVHNAVPLENVLKDKEAKPKQVYASAVRKGILTQPGITLGIYETDCSALGILRANHVSEERCIKVLMNSPRYQGLDESKKKAQVKEWIKTLEKQKDKPSERG